MPRSIDRPSAKSRCAGWRTLLSGSRLAISMISMIAMIAWTPIAIAAPPESEPVLEPSSAPVDPPDDAPPEPPPPSSSPDSTSNAEVEALLQRVDTLERQVEALRTSQAEVAAELGKAPPPKIEPEGTAAKVPPEKTSAPEDAAFNRPPDYREGFHFGSYGRVIAGGDHRGRAIRDADIVAHGSRLDEQTYAELELRREDYYPGTDAYTRIVATLAVAHPVFHYTGRFDINMGLRNLYIEESGLGLKRLRVWAGSRMYRGDDIYLLNFWPLDNLNTLGGGLAYTFLKDLTIKLHAGVNQPDSALFYQERPRPRPLEQPGSVGVRILDRQKVISSAKIENIFFLNEKGAGIKPVVYGEVHYSNEGQRETEPRQFESLPSDVGWVVGAQVGGFTGQRSTHLNLVVRYAGGLAAYGEFNAPTQLAPDRTSKGAREVLVAAGGNYEVGPFGLLLGAYLRTFRNASDALDYDDLNEGIAVLRPTLWIGKFAGVSLEGSYQAQRRGALVSTEAGGTRPQFGQMGRVGLVPFLTPGGRGSFTRPHIYLVYLASIRDDGARRLYPQDDVFALRTVDHFIGLGAEWWFGSTSYFRD
jgi:hypothetical protein